MAVIDKNSFPSDALYFSALHGHLGMVKYFVSVGASVNARSNVEDTPLHAAVLFGTSESENIIRFLLEMGADLEAVNDEGYTPLLQALSTRRYDQKDIRKQIVDILLDAGADVKKKTNRSITSVLAAVSNEQAVDGKIHSYRIVERLLKLGADPFAQSVDGRSAYGIAWHRKFKNIVDMIEKLEGMHKVSTLDEEFVRFGYR